MTKKPSESRGKSKSADAGRKSAPAKKPKPAPKAKAPAKPAKPAAKVEKKSLPKTETTKAPKDAKPVAKPGAPKASTKAEAAAKPAPAKANAPKVSKPPAKGEGAEKGAPKAGTPKAPTTKPETKAAEPKADEKSGRKGITIVTPKRPRPGRARAVQTLMPAPATLTRLPRHPLIPSGPNAKVRAPLDEADPNAKKKSPFNKSQLEKYRKTLMQKRADLAGEIAGLEQEALRTSSGSLSHTPSHMAEQGTETAEQSLSLDLAAAERKLIREIDDAIKRVDEGTFGLCELTGRPIPIDRLDELPWTRYSIDAARELERRHYHR